MIEYDAEQGFTSSGWQDEDDTTLSDAVVRYHRRRGEPAGDNERLHGMLHVVAERQVAHRELPEALQALKRLVADGLSRHDALHGVARQTTYLSYHIQRGELDGDPTAALRASLERIALLGLVGEFQFSAPLFGRPEEDESLDAGEEPRDDAWDDDRLESWVAQLGDHFRASPEGQGVAAGWAERFLAGQLRWGLHPAAVANAQDAVEKVMAAPMDMPCEADDAEAIVAELEAFHRFAARVFGWSVGEEAAAALRGDLVVRQLRAAIADTPKLDEVDAMLRARGVDPEDDEQLAAFVAEIGPAFDDAFRRERDREPAPVVPIHREHPKVGRNAPCPCGSGRKYKRCCGR